MTNWAADATGEDSAHVMDSLEAAVPVSLVATFELETCDADEPLANALGRMDLAGFEYMPVKVDGHVVAVLERLGVLAGEDRCVRDAMKALHESMLMSATDPLLV